MAQKWTDEEVAQCAELLKQNLKSTEIAEIMGKTKGAIIGQVGRNPELKKIGFAFAPLPLTLSQQKIHAARQKKRDAQVIKVIPLGITLIDLKPVHCRFPLWPNEARIPIEERFFCGAARTEDSSYCPKHYALCRAKVVRHV